ncbi:MAG: glycosyltransferase [Nitrospinota bacterium]
MRNGMRVALIHDWLTGMRGGERVLEVLCELFPGAEIFTLVHREGSVSPAIEAHPIHTSFLQRLPAARRHYRRYLPLMPLAVEQFDLRGFDLVISSSHCVAKGALTRPETPHLCYLHTPMRYAWSGYHDYFGEGRLGPVGRLLVPPLIHYLRLWDAASVHRVDAFCAISEAVARRVQRYYGRQCQVIHPFVDLSRFEREEEPEGYYLLVAAMVPYKRTDLALAAFRRLGSPLKVVGTGPEMRRLQRDAPSNAEFLGWQSDEALASLYARARALIFPGEEDFGIVPLEAMAAGRPVVAFGRGGALETVVGLDGAGEEPPTGLFFGEQTPESLAAAVRRFEEVEGCFSPAACRARARRFSRESFRAALAAWVEEAAERHRRSVDRARSPAGVPPC